jgi:hypothetical protein
MTHPDPAKAEEDLADLAEIEDIPDEVLKELADQSEDGFDLTERRLTGKRGWANGLKLLNSDLRNSGS